MDCGEKTSNVKEESATEIAGYEKLRGFATTDGQDYEVALCCLFFLRALRHASDFYLATNCKFAGKFDDVVLLYRLKGDQGHGYRAIFLQAKHRDNPKSFKLQEYLKSFSEIQHLWVEPLQVGNRKIQLHEIKLILYTNTGCTIGDAMVDVTENPKIHHLKDFVYTQGQLLQIMEAKRVRLPEGDDTSNFLAHLFLCTEQMSVEASGQFLEEELSRVLKLTSTGVARKLKNELIRVVKAWWSKENAAHFLTVDSKEWKTVLDMQIKRLNGDTLNMDRRLSLNFTEVTLEEFTMSWMCVRDEYQAKTVSSRLFRAQRNALIIDDRQLNSVFDEIEVLWGNNICPTLVVDLSADSPEEGSPVLQRLQEAARSDSGRRLVIIARRKPPSSDWSEVPAEPTWFVLHPDIRDRLLETPVTLQGKVVLMRDVVGSYVTDVMTDEVITNLSTCETPINLGTALPESLQYYVPRCLERKSSEAINFDLLSKTNALIFSSSYYLPLNEFKNQFKIFSPFDIKTAINIKEPTIVRDMCNEYDIRQLCFRLRVRGILGDISTQGLHGKVKEFIPFIWNTNEKIIVIEGPPGVGKSSFVTMMSSRVKEEFPETWVLRLDLGRHTDYIKDRDFTEVSDIKDLLLKSLRQDLNSLEQQLLEHSLSVTGNVFLFLDAFDEISPYYTRQCCDLLKGIAQNFRYRQMVVTTRPITTSDVEEALQTMAFTLPVFKKVEQRLFLKQFSMAREKNVSEDEISSLLHTAGTVLQIPLLCRMASEVLVHHHEKSIQQFVSPWRRVLLYELFVEETVKDCVAAKFELDISNPAAKKVLESHKNSHLVNLQGLAVRKLMPLALLPRHSVSMVMPDEKFGLVVNTGGRVDFKHQTIAEYFLGCWLACHWQKCRREFLGNVLFREGFEFVAVTFSWSLFDGFPLHMAVAQGDVDAVRTLVSAGTADRGGDTALYVEATTQGDQNEVWELLPSLGEDLGIDAVKPVVSAGTTDRGGRTALHVAAMTQGNHRQVWELLLASGKDLNREDDVLGTSSIRYAAISSNWEFFDAFLTKQGDLQFNVLGNTAMKILLQAVKKDLTGMCQFMMSNQNYYLYQFDREGNTLLHMAAANNSLGVMKLLIERCHKLNIRNKTGQTPLQKAVEHGKIEAIRLLVENGANLNIKTEEGWTALMCAAKNGHLEVVNILLEKGSDLSVETEEGWTALIIAAQNGHLEVVKILFDNGADLNIKTVEGWTAVIIAAQSSHLDVVKILIEIGADLNIKTVKGWTALMWAAFNGHSEVVNILLENGADLNVKNQECWTALMCAAFNGHFKVVNILLENGDDLNIQTEKGWTALTIASQNGHLEVVRILLYNGADFNIKTEEGRTTLMCAAKNGHWEVVKILLEKGSDLNIKTDEGLTALTIASQYGHLEVVKILLENGADLNVKNQEGWTPLMWAAFNGHTEVVKVLLENGDDSNIQTEKGWTALTMASKNGHVEVVKVLFYNGANFSIKTEEGWTALMCAAKNNHLEVVNILLEKGSDLNIKTEEGLTALTIASQYGHLEVVNILLENGADLNGKNQEGWTALMWAAFKGHSEVVKVLLENGDDSNIQTEKGWTALTIASQNGHLEVVNILLVNGANLNMKTEKGSTALTIASEYGHLEVVKILSENGADLNVKNQESWTALMWAAFNGHLEVVKILLDIGADLNIKTEKGSTALTIASQSGHLEVVKVLLFNGANLNIKTEEGRMALMCAAENGNLEVVNILLEKGFDLNINTVEGLTALIIAAQNGNLEMVKILLHNGADSKVKNKED